MEGLYSTFNIYRCQYRNVRKSSLERIEKRKLYVEIKIQCDYIEQKADEIQIYNVQDPAEQGKQRKLRKKLLAALEKLRTKCIRRHGRLEKD